MPQREDRYFSVRQRRITLVVSGAAVGALVIALGAYFTLRSPSPSRVVDSYVSAMARANYEKAYSELATSSQRSVRNPDGLAQTSIGAVFRNGIADSYTLGPTSDAGKDRKSVEVRLTKGSSETVVRIFVVSEGGRWRAEV